MPRVSHRQLMKSSRVLFLGFLLGGTSVSGFPNHSTKLPTKCLHANDNGRRFFGRCMVARDPLEASPTTQECASSFLSAVVAVAFVVSSALYLPLPATAYSLVDESEVQGISAVTQSKLGQSVRGAVNGGAQFADNLDLKWERFSDRLRDEKKCDPQTNRRMFDNGTRRDGTKIGNPVLGALCTPEPLREFDSEIASTITMLAERAMVDFLPDGMDRTKLRQLEEQVQEKVGPAFARAAASTESKGNEEEASQVAKRQSFNQDLYIRMRAYGQSIPPKQGNYQKFERKWGENVLMTFARNSNRNDYSSPFPKPDATEDQPYDEATLLDALGAVSVTLSKLQGAGLIGHWEISIPEDDFWNVVTIAVDDDISIGGQILARESKAPLSGSVVIAVIRSAMEDKARIPYRMDTFFIDPTTTQQELYNPTQLLVSLSDLGM